MSVSATAREATYDLPLGGPGGAEAEPYGSRVTGAFATPLVIRNTLWFCTFRWLVAGVLALLGVLGLVPGLLAALGLRIGPWALVTAGVLVILNAGFRWHAGRLKQRPSLRRALRNLWSQIVGDLLVLTAVVHFAGSLETGFAFAYLFHIVLACIFFTRPYSLLVTALACGLYVACVVADQAGWIPGGGIYLDDSIRRHIARTPLVVSVNLVSTLAVWLVVWYLASHLSAMVQRRDRQLGETNRRLEAVLRERTQHMLRTTHELKAPFAAIDANTQLLLKGHCGPLPEEAEQVVRRIASRARRLAQEIQEMLQLANLRSSGVETLPRTRLDLAEVVRGGLGQVRETAGRRQVRLDADLVPTPVTGVKDHLEMLAVNLLANAVGYSRPGGRVRVRCRPADGGGADLAVRDEGIGIPPDKLPRIFEEYYRTNEAARHNPDSTGLGLAIVRHVADLHGIRIRVRTEAGRGTTFEVHVPPAGAVPVPPEKETRHGVPDAD
ncbi:MAG: HAMP domain-containing sensor histidine kinase [Phycisphaerae bacterium]